MTTPLDDVMTKVRSENRAALIAYVPAGFPSIDGCKKVIDAFIRGGVDAIEIGFPYSDPVMDGPTIQAAANQSLMAGTGAKEVFDALGHATSQGVAAVVMTYWNPIEKYGVDAFAQSIASHGGSGVITPDLTIEEASGWKSAVAKHGINSIFVVAPSSGDERLKAVTDQCSGFVYTASLMGVTGTRTDISSSAGALVARLRGVTDKPLAVGLGVSTRAQAKEVAAFADGVIVGSAFIKLLLDSTTLDEGLEKVEELARELAQGVREGR